jgi:sugar lactone lactonase YvrE
MQTSPALKLLFCLLFFTGISASQDTASPERNIFEISRKATEAYKKKDYAEYLRLIEQAREIAPNNPGVAWGLARAYARLERPEEALKWLDKLAAMGGYYDVNAAPDFEDMRQMPAFQAVTVKIAEAKKRVGTSTVAFRVPEAGLDPESIAYDPKDKGFFLGSSKRKIAKWLPNGTVRDFVPSQNDGLFTVLGIKLDARRRELWVNSCNLGPGAPMSPGDPTTIGQAAIHRYHADSAKLLAKHVVGTKEQPGCANDLAIAPNGDVFATYNLEAGGGSILRVQRSTGKLETFYKADASFAGNGIAISADGKTLYVADSARGVIKIDVRSRKGDLLPSAPDVAMISIDGLYVYKNSLIAIQNAPSITRVARFPLSADGARVTGVHVLERNHPMFTIPTTGVIVGDTLFYVANTATNPSEAKGDPKVMPEPVILKLRLF